MLTVIVFASTVRVSWGSRQKEKENSQNIQAVKPGGHVI